MFLDALAFAALATATTEQMDVVPTQRAGATCGDPTAVVNAWDFSRNGENKSLPATFQDFCWNFWTLQFLRWFLSAFDLLSFIFDWINNGSRPKRSNVTWINERQLNSIWTHNGNWIIWKSFLWSSLSTFIGNIFSVALQTLNLQKFSHHWSFLVKKLTEKLSWKLSKSCSQKSFPATVFW